MNTPLLFNLTQHRRRIAETLRVPAVSNMWRTIVDKYSDKAHFIYELLQNADDAEATLCRFILETDQLLFIHNGKIRFSITDPETEDIDSENNKLGHINSITSVANSNKADSKIGKYGVGFKAVFQYTNTPQIYDDTFSFKIEDYIVPVEIEDHHPKRNVGETLFVLPFDSDKKGEEQSYSEILEKLKSLFFPNLFLKSLITIHWQSVQETGYYTKEVQSYVNEGETLVQNLVLKQQVNDQTVYSRVLLFSHQVLTPRDKVNHRISIGYFIDNDGAIEVARKYEVFCFFPTKEETDFPFIMDAPFLLTDSRERIRSDVDWNTYLVKCLAQLFTESIKLFKILGHRYNMQFLTDGILNIIPYKKREYRDRLDFNEFYFSTLNLFKFNQIIPGRDNWYSKSHSYWASDTELANLFSDSQLSQLTGLPNSGWVFISKGQKQVQATDKDLEKFILEVVRDSFDPKKILRKLNKQFMEQQSIDWVIELYAYLDGRKHLWDDKEGFLKKLPILLNQSRQAIKPFEADGTTPSVFFPSDFSDDDSSIFTELMQNDRAVSFFRNLGLGPSDNRTEMLRLIHALKLDVKNDEIDEKLSLKYCQTIFSLIDGFPEENIAEFSEKLKDIKFLIGFSINGETEVLSPNELYFDSPEIREYFSNAPRVFFADLEFYSTHTSLPAAKLRKILHSIGVSSIPRIITRMIPFHQIDLESFGMTIDDISQTHFKLQTMIDYALDHFESAITSLTLEKSLLIWNYVLEILSKSPYALVAIYTYVPFRKQFEEQKTTESTFFRSLKFERWVYDDKGNLAESESLTLSQLNSGYDINHPYAKALFKILRISDESESELNSEQKEMLRLGKLIQDYGLTEDEIKQLYIEKQINARGKIPAANVKVSEEKQARKKNLSDILMEKQGSKRIPDQEISKDADDDILPKEKLDELEEKIKKELLEATMISERLDELKETINNSEVHSYLWFKSLIELEDYSRKDLSSKQDPFYVIFNRVEYEINSTKILTLYSSSHISNKVEDAGSLALTLNYENHSRTIIVEAVSRQNKVLKAKLPESDGNENLRVEEIVSAKIEVRDANFLYEVLRNAFQRFSEFPFHFKDEYNFKFNLPENIEFILGPPGTGKTTYLITDRIMSAIERESFRVLVLTPTNKAADVVCTTLIQLFEKKNDHRYLAWLRRFGITNDPSLESTVFSPDRILKGCQLNQLVMVTTVTRFLYDRFVIGDENDEFPIRDFYWDAVVFDESSMIGLPHILFAIYYRRHFNIKTNFVVLGDPFQIPAITIADYPNWTESNIYSLVNLNDTTCFVSPRPEPHPFKVTTLTKQFRSIPAIGKLVSTLTYENVLDHHRIATDIKQMEIGDIKLSPITIIDFPVNDFIPLFRSNSVNKSHYQIYSSIFVYELLQYFNELSRFDGELSIGIICPYRFQKDILDKLITTINIKNGLRVVTGTIHGFQGDECDVIVSLFNPPKFISDSKQCFLNKLYIINVAISRARDYLILMMPFDREDEQKFKKLLYLEKMRSIVRKDTEIADSTLVYRANQLEELMFGNSSYIEENSFPTAHQSVNIYSRLEKKYEIRYGETAVDIQIRW